MEETDSGRAEMQEGKLSPERYLHRGGKRATRDSDVSDVQTLSRDEQEERERARKIRETRGDFSNDKEAEAQAKVLHVIYPWDTLYTRVGEHLISMMLREIERGQGIIAKRINDLIAANPHCSNQDCLKPLKDEQHAVSVWSIRDPRTQIFKTYYSCSQRCHAIVHNLQQNERIIK